MILNLQILNEDITLNNFTVESRALFIPGNPLKLIMRLYMDSRNLRYIPGAAATFSMTFKKSDNTTLVKVPSVKFSDDRSILELSLTGSETQNLIGQDLKLEITEGLDKHVALLSMGLSSISTIGCN